MRTIKICGLPRPKTYMYRNWPLVCCLLPLGHESDHCCERSDAVRFVWPYQPDDLERLRARGVV